MDLYICSTVRHLLLSVMRALAHPERQAHIVLFYDYQGLDPEMLQPEVLPGWVQLHLLQRRELSRTLGGSAKGKLLYFMAMRNLSLPGSLRRGLLQAVQCVAPKLADALDACATPALLLFNEKNKMSRLFSRLTDSYTIIEDGEGNYRRLKVAAAKRPIRWLQGRTPAFKVFGEEPRCRRILVLHPKRVPDEVRHKARKIEFLQLGGHAPKILALFRLSPGQTKAQQAVILATQPLQTIPGIGMQGKVTIYRILVDLLTSRGFQVLLKAHPREERQDYQPLADRATLVDAKVPLEALLLGFSSPVTIVSIMSSAGMGFDHLCRRLKLVDKQLEEAVSAWQTDPEPWKEALEHALSTGEPLHP